MKLPGLRTAKHNSIVDADTLNQLCLLKPKKVVDVGSGDGFYGKLLKHALPDVYSIAVEKRKDYIKNWNLASHFDEVINADIVDVIGQLEGDLIIFGDVLEHLVKEDMTRVLGTSVQRFGYVIVNSPLGFQPQKHEFEEEVHRCGLDRSDFDMYDVMTYTEYDDPMFHCLLRGNK